LEVRGNRERASTAPGAQHVSGTKKRQPTATIFGYFLVLAACSPARGIFGVVFPYIQVGS
jgi:hypothetical protein